VGLAGRASVRYHALAVQALARKTDDAIDPRFLADLPRIGKQVIGKVSFKPLSFLLGPGGGDYVGANSYDAGLAG
jgi:hypothetical protein